MTSSKYFGRMPIGLVTEDGSPAAGYVVTVRSLPNKKRKFWDKGDRLYMGPLREGSESEIKGADLIFYNTMLRRGDLLIVTNGQQIDGRSYSGKRNEVPNFEDNFLRRDEIGSSEKIMQQWGYEPDSMKTPRVALVRTPYKCIYSMASELNGDVSSGAISVTNTAYVSGLPTYTEQDGSVVSWHLRNSGVFHDCLIRLPSVELRGNTAQEIADKLFEYIDPGLLVATAGAVYRNGTWEVGFKNMFNTEEDFERFERDFK